VAGALSALRTSVNRLSGLVRPLREELGQRAYPSAWTIADVVAHVGSSGVIMQRRLDDALAGRDLPDDFAESVWAEWDAKSPQAKADDGLAVDEAFTSRLESMGSDARSAVSVRLGPVTFDWETFVLTRLSEHLLHQWDVAVVFDPSATLAADGVAYVVDNLDLVARYTAIPIAPERTLTVATTGPERTFAVTVASTTVEFSSIDPIADPVLRMPAESFIRLVYGRLDHDHTPPSVEGEFESLDQLRQVFPGP
jgi:uncharacterized protein (TIGR03083 family)